MRQSEWSYFVINKYGQIKVLEVLRYFILMAKKKVMALLSPFFKELFSSF
jgi:hypothetical protein